MKGESDANQAPGAGVPSRHRVIVIDEPLREALRSRRSTTGQTVREFVAEALEAELPSLVAALAELGVAMAPGERGRPIRLAVAPNHLAALVEAASVVGIPACRLLRAVLARSARRKRRRVVPAAGRGESGGPKRDPDAADAGRSGGRQGSVAEPDLVGP